ncbi:2-amino-4-hydroxy-6-hydroxymethyldihydropteridine diphosphokinase [Nannocystis pusilla]|uniref:2-amino-4-hydroxy-6- hydroxymethyldihydropteridine diphosphokinase n=1 Tax=Nannocystis pusilla TaxID=889268 RepID=UPI003B79C71C
MIPATELLRCSPVFETRPLGPSLHPFLNAAVELRTELAPEDLLTELLALEARHGRTRRERWEARTLDLDLLVMTEDGRSLRVDTDRLVLPHPELARRDFVLAPLAALRPDLRPEAAPRRPSCWPRCPCRPHDPRARRPAAVLASRRPGG